jgi:hypothetical protein
MSSLETVNTETLKVSSQELSTALSNKTDTPPIDQERLKRVELRKQQLQDKLKEMRDKYFNKDDPRSIPNALLKHAELGNENIYINLVRSDFTGWHTFVKGGYKNAHPRKCAHMFLRYAVEYDFLPNNVTWNIWNNQSFTVVFDIQKTVVAEKENEEEVTV